MKDMFNLRRVGVLGLFLVVLAFSATGALGASNNRVIPDGAKRVSSNVYYLGKALDPARGDMVEGYAIVHPRQGYGKPAGTPGGGGKACYGFLAKGAKWKSLESWVVNPSNEDGISENSIFSIVQNGIAKWEDAADGAVGGGSVNILGNGTQTSATLVADTTAMDNLNEVYFDALDEGTIGVTIVWGIFGGPTFGRELREWDQVYNTFYPWATDGDPNKMDFDNIATHELGHSVGMGDLYDSACTEETMYGYGTEGEVDKRTLNGGDILGISTLY